MIFVFQSQAHAQTPQSQSQKKTESKMFVGQTEKCVSADPSNSVAQYVPCSDQLQTVRSTNRMLLSTIVTVHLLGQAQKNC